MPELRINSLSEFKRPTAGRPNIYTPEELVTEVNKYFKWCNDNPVIKQDFVKSGQNAGKKVSIEIDTPYTLEGLCIFLKVSTQYLRDLKAAIKHNTNEKLKEEFSKYSLVLKYIYNRVSAQRLQGGMTGLYNPLIVSRLEGLSDKQEVKQETNANISVNVTDPKLKDKLNLDSL